jgi:putative ABC transport system ATP-binding protein
VTGAVAVAVRGLSHRYRVGGSSLQVLDDVTFSIDEGGYAALTGPSGAGKTTLLSVLGGLEAVQDGEVRVGDQDIARLAGDALAAYRRETVGFVFQHFGLLDTLTARENVELALALRGRSPRTRRHEARDLLAAVGLEAREAHRPHQLSGGERQRVAIARALANRPRLLLADEPTGNLDTRAAASVLGLLETLPGASGVTVVVVTHNPTVAERAPVRLRLEDGRLLEAGARATGGAGAGRP